MKTLLKTCIILVHFLCLPDLQAQGLAVTEEGDKIIVYPNGTWTYIGEEKIECFPKPEEEKLIVSWKEGDVIYSHIETETQPLLLADSIQVIETYIDTLVYSVFYNKDGELIDRKYTLRSITRINIGVEIFEMVGKENKPQLYDLKRKGGYITYKGGSNYDWIESKILGEYSLEEAKIICANMYMNILKGKMTQP